MASKHELQFEFYESHCVHFSKVAGIQSPRKWPHSGNHGIVARSSAPASTARLARKGGGSLCRLPTSSSAAIYYSKRLEERWRVLRGNKEVVGGVRCLDMEVFTAQVIAVMREEALGSFLAYLTMLNVQRKSMENIFSEGLAQVEGGWRPQHG